jgi:hypothetical protein
MTRLGGQILHNFVGSPVCLCTSGQSGVRLAVSSYLLLPFKPWNSALVNDSSRHRSQVACRSFQASINLPSLFRVAMKCQAQ